MRAYPKLCGLWLAGCTALLFTLNYSAVGYLGVGFAGIILLICQDLRIVPRLLGYSAGWVSLLGWGAWQAGNLHFALDAFGWLYSLAVTPFFIAIFYSLDLGTRQKIIQYAIVLIAGYTIVIAFNHTASTGWNHRIAYPLHDHNNLGALAYCLIFPMLGLLVENSTTRAKLGYALLIAGLILVLFLTRSRISFLLFIFGIGTWIMFFKNQLLLGWTPTKKIVTSSICILSIVLVAHVSGLGSRLSSISSTEASTQSRVALLTTGLVMLQTKPTGYGLGSWPTEYAKVRSSLDTDSSGNMAHNDYIEVGVHMGVVASLLLGVPLLYAAWLLATRHNTIFQKSALLSFVLISIHLGGNYILRYPGLYFFASLVAFGALEQTSVKIEKKVKLLPIFFVIPSLAVLLIIYELNLLTR